MQGDGIEFKRLFVRLHDKLSALICKDSLLWLTQNGLTVDGTNAELPLKRLAIRN